jgi:hypothetical protein
LSETRKSGSKGRSSNAVATDIRYYDHPKFGEEFETVSTIIGILIDMDVHCHNIKALRNWTDFKQLSSTKTRGMFFHGIRRDSVAFLVINLCKLLSMNTSKERQSFQVLLKKLKAKPPKQCDVPDLAVLQNEHDEFHGHEADLITTLVTYRDKRFAHRDPNSPDDGTHLIPEIERMVEHCQAFLVRILTVAYKPQSPIRRAQGHPTMFIDGLIEDYRELARLRDNESANR